MAALHYAPPSADSLNGWAYTVDDFPKEIDVDVWGENWEALVVYQQNSNQWRMGPAGPYAFDMVVFRHELDRRGLTRERYDEMLWALRTIESAALAEIA